jgi:hypothetical protein
VDGCGSREQGAGSREQGGKTEDARLFERKSEKHKREIFHRDAFFASSSPQ